MRTRSTYLQKFSSSTNGRRTLRRNWLTLENGTSNVGRYTHTHTIVLLLFWNLSRTTQVSRYQKGKNQEGKTNLDLLEQEIVSGSGICWAISKSASHLT